MNAWYNYSWNEVVSKIESNIYRGLSEEKIEYNRKKFGENATLNIKIKSSVFLFLMQIIKLYSLIGLGVSGVLFYKKDFLEGAILSTVTLLCVILFCLKQYNSEKTLKELEKITPKSALVLRGGKSQKIDCKDLVIGDIVYLEKGDIVPADLRILECEELKIKESAITGDNTIVEKYSTKIEDKEIDLSDMKNLAFKSSFVIDGRGKGIVISVGANTHIGEIIQSLLEDKEDRNVLEKNVLNIINMFSKVYLVFAVLVCLYGLYTKSINFSLELIPISYLILVPSEMILVVFMISRIIKKKMNKLTIDFKGLSSIQRLSNIDLIFIDKIGLLTEEKMYLEKFFTNSKILDADSNALSEHKDNLDRIINIGVLCNDVKRNLKEETLKGKLTEISLLKYASKYSTKENIDLKDQKRIFLIPYDKDKRIKTTVNEVENNYRANVVGAVDTLLKKCTHIMKNGIEVEITYKDLEEIRTADMIMSKESLYVEGFAYRNFNYEPSLNENIESNLVFVGLVGFNNPIKENLNHDLNYCRSLAIKPAVMTKENKIAADAFGKRVGLLNKNDIVLSGVEIDHMEDEEIENSVEKVSIFSRISSKNKWQISGIFKKLGYNLAVTGTRFTDYPSFRKAHIGIAAGRDCTNIIKKLSDVYIKNSDFVNLLSLIEESRKVMNVLKNVMLFVLMSMILQFSVLMLPIILGYGIPMSSIQFMFVNFIIVTLSSIYIYYQHGNIHINNFERIKINKDVFKNFTTSMTFYGILVGILSLATLVYENKYKVPFSKYNIFIIINISLFIFSNYFFNFKNVMKNKVFVLLCIFILLIGVLMWFFYKSFFAYNLQNIGIIAITSFIEIVSLICIKEIKSL